MLGAAARIMTSHKREPVNYHEHIFPTLCPGNEKRLTGAHETCSIKEFKYGVADRGASIRIPRETERDGRGYMEDRRPAANCDPYKVTGRMVQTTGECLMPTAGAASEASDVASNAAVVAADEAASPIDQVD